MRPTAHRRSHPRAAIGRADSERARVARGGLRLPARADAGGRVQRAARAERQAQHARIGEAIEQVYADRLSEHFGVLAHHFTRAQRWDKALEYLLAAAQQAEQSFATREALALYDEARRRRNSKAGGVGDPARSSRIHEAKARLYFVTSDFERSAAEGERILPLARLTGDSIKEAEALATIAWASTWGRNLDAAVRFSREALAVGGAGRRARGAGPRAFHDRVRARRDRRARREPASRSTRRWRSAAPPAMPCTRSLSLSTAGLLRNWAGDYAEAARLQSEGHALARDRGLLVPLLFSCFLRGLTLTARATMTMRWPRSPKGCRSPSESATKPFITGC